MKQPVRSECLAAIAVYLGRFTITHNKPLRGGSLRLHPQVVKGGHAAGLNSGQTAAKAVGSATTVSPRGEPAKAATPLKRLDTNVPDGWGSRGKRSRSSSGALTLSASISEG